jgi:hypothetical protein
MLVFCVVDDPEFTEVIRQAEAAIDAGAFPVRIYQVRTGNSLISVVDPE